MNKRALTYSMIIVMLMVLVGCNNVNTDTTNTLDVVFNNNTALNVPTMINKIEDTYYIVDCYNNNILYSKELNEKLENWYRIPEEFHQPHSIIGDGKFFIVVDTENNRLVTFKKEKDTFVKLEEINEFGSRPHFGMFLENKYYIWDGIDTMYVYEERGYELVLDKSYVVPSLSGTYVRSFSYIDEKWYFPTSNGKIIVTDTKFEVVSEYTVPNNIAGLSYIYRAGEYWYVNVFTDINYDTSFANLVRCKELEDLQLENYESLYEQFGLVSAPYYVNYFDGAYYMATLNGKSAIYRLDIGEDGSIDCVQIF